MTNNIDSLPDKERGLLYRAPVLLSLLAAGVVKRENEARKNDAIKLAHLRTFTADPLLHEYYRQVETVFKDEYEAAEKKYAPFDTEKRNQVKRELRVISAIIGKLNPEYAQVLSKSLESYARHVRNATHSVFQDIIFPITYSRL